MPTRSAKHKIETPKSEKRRTRHSEGNCATCTRTISGAKTKNALVSTTPLNVFRVAVRATGDASNGSQRAAQKAPQRNGSVQQRSPSVPVGVAFTDWRYAANAEPAT